MLGKSIKIVEPRRFDLYVEDIRAKDFEAVVRIDYGAICKADLRYFLGDRDKRTLGLKYPMSLIHEAVGTIISDRSHTFLPQEKVVLSPNIMNHIVKKCTNCVCDVPELGENFCPQAKFASSTADGFSKEYVVHPIANLFRIPDDVNPVVATFAELFSVAVAACRRFDVEKYETIGIWGDGILGYILSLVVNHLFSACRVIMVGRHMEKLEDFQANQHYLTGDPRIHRENIDLVFECVGGTKTEKAINEAIDCLTVGGRIVLTGVSEKAVCVNSRKILEKGILITGSTRSSNKDFETALKILSSQSVRDRVNRLVLSEYEIRSIVDYYEIFEMELLNRKLGKNILKFEL